MVAAVFAAAATLIAGVIIASPANAEEVTPLPAPNVVPIQVTGPATDRLNLIVLGDGYQALGPLLPPPTRRSLILIDPPYELKTDYARVLAAVREVLQKFPDAVIAVWIPQLQRLEAQQLPQRLRNAFKGVAKKGWLDAQLTVAPAQDGGFGLLGSHMVVCNPPHTLGLMLAQELPWLAERLGQFPGAKGSLATGA